MRATSQLRISLKVKSSEEKGEERREGEKEVMGFFFVLGFYGLGRVGGGEEGFCVGADWANAL